MAERLSFSKSDRDSIYSFDSVSTNERLLDRLDFDNESVVSVDSYKPSAVGSRGFHDVRNRPNPARGPNIGPIAQKLGPPHSSSQPNCFTLPQQPMNSLNAIRRMKDYAASGDLMGAELRDPGFNEKRNPYTNVTTANKNVASSHAVVSGSNNVNGRMQGISSQSRAHGSPNTNYVHQGATNLAHLNTSSQRSINASFGNVSNTTLPISEMELQKTSSKFGGQEGPSISSASSINSRYTPNYDKSHQVHAVKPDDNSIETAHIKMSNMSLISIAQDNPNHSGTLVERMSSKNHEPAARSDIKLGPRVASLQSHVTEMGKPFDHGLYEQSSAKNPSANGSTGEYVRDQVTKSQEVSPESRVMTAQELRAQGNHREASYQLQIAANEPFNYSKAMYLYAIALKHGQGVKQNYNSSIKWLCKCILTTQVSEKNDQPLRGLLSKLNKLSQRDLLQLVLADIERPRDIGGLRSSENPEVFYNHFKSFSKIEVNKIMARNKSKADVVALSYFEIGMYLLHGMGGDSNHKTDEAHGISCLSKSAAMCCVEAMEQLGEVWATKTKFRKKDLSKAAAWLRSAEIFGAKSIGNSWIYKEKYLKSTTN
ncbi:hypothetical protein KGF57_001310 [Candida theae]|uniref:Protein DSF2 n=1 Tax=Candida theae TaxID=1198502 RepID=A0AAD5G008_9ASCO|nr:uncharacterized protein KGF57_001310 [Candida theae]KAI5963365.1 hypothetical protein KGF57_001310 [Candida theae]